MSYIEREALLKPYFTFSKIIYREQVMKNNLELCHHIILELLHFGVKEFILCAGARNSPFVVYLDHFKTHIKVYHFFEERSGSFFALGRSAQSQRPVAIITTSGTAAAELLPATIEAHYSSLPLILITADRPASYRLSGSPQSIEQMGLYSHYIESDFDLNITHLLNRNVLSSLSWKKPIHINVGFDEPLIDGDIKKDFFEELNSYMSNTTPHPQTHLKEINPSKDLSNKFNELIQFINHYRPLVILGPIKKNIQNKVCQFLINTDLPIYAEGTSGLRGHPKLISMTIKSGELFLKKLFDQGICNAILRIGGVPTLRLWRDLENKLNHIPVFSVSDNTYSGLSRSSFHIDQLDMIDRIYPFMAENFEQKKNQISISREDSFYYDQIKLLIEEFPQSEPALIHNLSEIINKNYVYLGNSLPIREWDLAGSFDNPPESLFGNRGANGIDGQISTFLGWSHPVYENWGIFGDLTTLYDLAAPWISQQLGEINLRIVIINNSGGQIFKRMFPQSSFINAHQINFFHWSQFWKWDYQKWSKIPREPKINQKQIIEINPCPQDTDLFWRKYEDIFKK